MNNLNIESNGPESIEHKNISVPQWDSPVVFGKNSIFRVENFGSCKMFFIQITIVPNGATTYPLPTSPYIFENIFLECNGNPIARVNTTYSLSRIDDLSGTGLYDKINTGASLSGVFDNTQTIVLPLFFYVIDGQTFDSFNYNNITIRTITKSSAQSMGFNIDPLSISLKLVTVYDQYRDENYQIISGKVLKNSYNITSDSYFVASTDTSEIIKLNNQSKIKSLIFMIRRNSNAGIAVLINSVKLRYSNGTEEEYNNLTNYNFTSQNGTNDGKIFKIKFNTFTKINGNMNPTQATINFVNSQDATLFVIYEYESIILEQNRILLETFEESLY